jgi:glycerol-3-phosphate acyltransferase PlsX
LGVNAPVLVGHGISTPEAIKNMLLLSRDMVETDLVGKIREAFREEAAK